MKKNQTILIILGILILGLVFGLVCWFNFIKQPGVKISNQAEEKKEISQEEAIKIVQEKYRGEIIKIEEEKIPISKEESYTVWVVQIKSGENISKIEVNKETGEIISEENYSQGGEKEIFLKPEREGGEKPKIE